MSVLHLGIGMAAAGCSEDSGSARVPVGIVTLLLAWVQDIAPSTDKAIALRRCGVSGGARCRW
ncbi:hypothetical protein [Mycobacterium canetti]|uniref:Uncharacterized protein n=1 Tax=Mycobacterium canetti TaxID=78331 RepID=A0ABV1MJY1_9MYCO|nr:hypothetical protein [Mycobacterium canetti]MBA2787149.1 hypothetical protein [Mycobacterium canetti]